MYPLFIKISSLTHDEILLHNNSIIKIAKCNTFTDFLIYKF